MANNYNAGNYNAGNYNAGNHNAGNHNAGNYNAGNYNAGNYNAGYYNAGYYNAGNYNAGNYNAGYYNAGYYNAGNYNAGYYNAGNYNAGNYNAGNYNAGYFCTEHRSPSFFDKPTNLDPACARTLVPMVDLPVATKWIPSVDMTEAQKGAYPSHKTTGGILIACTKPLRETFPVAWSKMDDATKARFTSLPNFDAEKFLKITGVDVRKTSKLVKVKLAGGEVVQGELVD